jgi:hypothetical protein
MNMRHCFSPCICNNSFGKAFPKNHSSIQNLMGKEENGKYIIDMSEKESYNQFNN